MTKTGNGPTHRFEYDQEESLVVVLADALTAVHGTEATTLPPLENVISCDALEELVTKSDVTVSVMFRYADLQVTVHSDGQIEIYNSE